MTRKIKRVLLIVDDPAIRDILADTLESNGRDVFVSPNNADGINKYIKIKPDLVIVNIQSYDDLEIVRDFFNTDPLAHIMITSPNHEHNLVVECMRCGAIDFINKPVQALDIISAINRIENRSRLISISSESDIDCVKSEDKTLVFGNNTENLPTILNQAVFNAQMVCPEIDGLKMALGEIILNSIEHGNLNISMSEKSDAIQKGIYSDFLKERMTNLDYADRVITLSVHMDSEKLVYDISDQGNGFDYKNIFNSDPYSHFGSGLGLRIANSFFNQIQYVGTGNHVRLVYLSNRRKNTGDNN